MNNLNPMFSAMNMSRSASPFAVAGSTVSSGIRNATRGGHLSRIGGGSKFSLSGILSGAQKTIGTVNQIVPLYNQVKPLFQNSKVLFNVVKGIKGESSNTQSRGLFGRNRRRNFYNAPINTDIPKEPKIIKEEKNIDIKTKETVPAKPFFV